MDAIGLGDFLPDSPMGGTGDEKQESITMKIKEVKQKKKETPKKNKKKQKTEDIDEVLMDAGIDDGVGTGDEQEPPEPGQGEGHPDLPGEERDNPGNG